MDTVLPANLAERSRKVIPGGINSCIRNYPPDFVNARAEGAYFWGEDGRRFTDYLGAWGPMILGYNHPTVKRKVKEAVDRYDLYGIGITEAEVVLAEKVCTYVRGIEKVLLCLGGSEATYHALRLARAYTGRTEIIKMQGGFHGWHDSVLMNVTSEPGRAYTYDPLSAGMLEDTARHTHICRINDLDSVESACRANKGQVAAIIVDPYCSTFGCLKMTPEFIRGLRDITQREGIVLIFDEVVSGFRLGLGGVTAKYSVTPDLVCLGKAIANGYPVAAVGGRTDIMEQFNTTVAGKVSYQATYYGNPVLAAAAVATIEELERPGFYEHLDATGDRLCEGLEAIAGRLGIDFCTCNCGSLIGLFWGCGPFENYDQMLARVDRKAANEFRVRMIDRGQYFAIGPFKRIVTSHAHSFADIDETLNIAETVMAEIARGF